MSPGITSRSRYALLFVTALAAAGCGNSQTSVVGQALRSDGTPLVGATVTARSEDTGKWASGITDENGRFELSPPGKADRLPPGTYYVTIAEAANPGFDADQQPPRTIPQKYEMPNTSGLQVEVAAGEPTVLDVKLDPLMQ